MRNASLLASAAVIVIANALALTHAARNRTGAPDAEITLTQRELRYFNDSVADDDSGVALNLQWTDLDTSALPTGVERIASLLDRQKLRSLGFACSVDPASPDAERYYQRQEARQVFVALEYNGAAWRAWAQSYEPAAAEEKRQGAAYEFRRQPIRSNSPDRHRCRSGSAQTASPSLRS